MWGELKTWKVVISAKWSSWRQNIRAPQGFTLLPTVIYTLTNILYEPVHPPQVCNWYKTGRSGWNKPWLCHCSAGSGCRNVLKGSQEVQQEEPTTFSCELPEFQLRILTEKGIIHIKTHSWIWFSGKSGTITINTKRHKHIICKHLSNNTAIFCGDYFVMVCSPKAASSRSCRTFHVWIWS